MARVARSYGSSSPSWAGWAILAHSLDTLAIHTTASGASRSTGLDMLAERLAAVGGTLTREHDSDRLVVAASLPLDEA